MSPVKFRWEEWSSSSKIYYLITPMISLLFWKWDILDKENISIIEFSFFRQGPLLTWKQCAVPFFQDYLVFAVKFYFISPSINLVVRTTLPTHGIIVAIARAACTKKKQNDMLRLYLKPPLISHNARFSSLFFWRHTQKKRLTAKHTARLPKSKERNWHTHAFFCFSKTISSSWSLLVMKTK